ncbi:MAG TPA: RtcB family protein, partial [Bacteroidales bacterium]|nr:RtcB family protein [Bacteroidales bacterium]
MPDTHQGYGMPIGGVLATRNAIIPNCVGVDVGCGVAAYRFEYKAADLDVEKRKAIMGLIRETIPLGFNHHARPVPIDMMPALPETNFPIPVIKEQFTKARNQLGTLGGGNHFIELQADEDGYLWAMVHSGSRNLGKMVCDHYNKVARDLNFKWPMEIPPSWQLDALPIGTPAAASYIAEMNFCLEFAKRSRAEMMRQVAVAIAKVTGAEGATYMLDIHHNYAAFEEHYGEKVWIHRKGATKALAEGKGIIPGSQGTHSYIVMGKGNHDSFMSCSHGSGRAMSRAAAKKNLNLDKTEADIEDSKT